MTDRKAAALTLLDEAEAARVIAERAGNAAAMLGATTLKARLAGLLSEEKAGSGETDGRPATELKSAARLISEAAESLGLPATATPAQIVGALAERPLATPEAFLLLHARALDGE